MNKNKNKKRWLIQGAIFVMAVSFVAGCGSGGSNIPTSGGPNIPPSQISLVQVSKGVTSESPCTNVWGNTQPETSDEQINCIPLEDKPTYTKVFVD